eukprot:TRINITY_DN3557_c0_g1_i2.p1 TRINITY_DN3557_c0_g1~~TRINITY_DN3557_c0_g1_i2.p1  ORF type:complete len:315 (+),score=70.09 TRINITY_DN3557_c0_g1_i2:78-1022(+)
MALCPLPPPASTQDARRLAQRDLVVEIMVLVAKANLDAPMAPDHDRRGDFDCIEVPAVSLENYCKLHLDRVSRPIHWPLVLLILHRLCSEGGVHFTPYSQHRLVITACTLALKMCHDKNGANAALCQMGGVAWTDLSDMEATLLALADWRISPPAGVYKKVADNLVAFKARATALAKQARCPSVAVDLLPAEIVNEWDNEVGQVPTRRSAAPLTGTAGDLNQSFDGPSMNNLGTSLVSTPSSRSIPSPPVSPGPAERVFFPAPPPARDQQQQRQQRPGAWARPGTSTSRVQSRLSAAREFSQSQNSELRGPALR